MTRMEYLDRLIMSGWGDVPNAEIPTTVQQQALSGGPILCRRRWLHQESTVPSGAVRQRRGRAPGMSGYRGVVKQVDHRLSRPTTSYWAYLIPPEAHGKRYGLGCYSSPHVAALVRDLAEWCFSSRPAYNWPAPGEAGVVRVTQLSL